MTFPKEVFPIPKVMKNSEGNVINPLIPYGRKCGVRSDSGVFRHIGPGYGKCGILNRIFVRQSECCLVAISPFLSSQPAFAIADVVVSFFFFIFLHGNFSPSSFTSLSTFTHSTLLSMSFSTGLTIINKSVR